MKWKVESAIWADNIIAMYLYTYDDNNNDDDNDIVYPTQSEVIFSLSLWYEWFAFFDCKTAFVWNVIAQQVTRLYLLCSDCI